MSARTAFVSGSASLAVVIAALVAGFYAWLEDVWKEVVGR